MYLSPHFTLDEFTASQTAARLGIDNDLPLDLVPTAKRTCTGLELVRGILGAPILISSGYRCQELNKAIGGSKVSQHMLAEAVDFTCPGFGTPDDIVKTLIARKVPFDQLIIEFGRWVHISFSDNPRGMALVIDKQGTRIYK